MTDSDSDFTGWLHAKLRALNTDESVFGDYIRGILEDDADSSADEQREALHDIISQIVADESDIDEVLDAILARWSETGAAQQKAAAEVTAGLGKLDIDAQLAKLLDNSKTICANSAVAKKRQPLSAEEMRIRDQILAQYSQVELDDADDDDDGGPPPASVQPSTSLTVAAVAAVAATTGAECIPTGVPGVVEYDPLMEKNTNKEDVAALARERREQARADSKAKKDKDKEDREKQKRDREEKKNARKTVKGERRR